MKFAGNSSLFETEESSLVSWQRTISGSWSKMSSSSCRALPRRLFTFIDRTLTLFESMDSCFGLVGELQQVGAKGVGLATADVSKILNGLDVEVMSDELNNELEKDGRPHDGQIHTQDGFTFISSYMCIDRPLQLLWIHIPHWSQQTAGSRCLTAAEHIPHGYFGLRGPGFVSISPASSKNNDSENRPLGCIDLLRE